MVILFCFCTYCIEIWVGSTFWLLWITPQWTFVSKSFYGYIFGLLLGRYVGTEFQDHTVTLSLTFWKTAQLFSKWPNYFILPGVNKGGSHFFTSLPAFILLFLFGYNLSNKYKMTYHCVFGLHWPFIHLLAILISPLVKCLLKFFVHV